MDNLGNQILTMAWDIKVMLQNLDFLVPFLRTLWTKILPAESYRLPRMASEQSTSGTWLRAKLSIMIKDAWSGTCRGF